MERPQQLAALKLVKPELLKMATKVDLQPLAVCVSLAKMRRARERCGSWLHQREKYRDPWPSGFVVNTLELF